MHITATRVMTKVIFIIDIVNFRVIIVVRVVKLWRNFMKLKTYSLRLEEEEFEKLRQFLGEYGDPDLNVSYILRAYIRDLNKALPNLKKSEYGIRNNLSFWSTVFRQAARTALIENMMKGSADFEKILAKSKSEEEES